MWLIVSNDGPCWETPHHCRYLHHQYQHQHHLLWYQLMSTATDIAAGLGPFRIFKLIQNFGSLTILILELWKVFTKVETFLIIVNTLAIIIITIIRMIIIVTNIIIRVQKRLPRKLSTQNHHQPHQQSYQHHQNHHTDHHDHHYHHHLPERKARQWSSRVWSQVQRQRKRRRKASKPPTTTKSNWPAPETHIGLFSYISVENHKKIHAERRYFCSDGKYLFRCCFSPTSKLVKNVRVSQGRQHLLDSETHKWRMGCWGWRPWQGRRWWWRWRRWTCRPDHTGGAFVFRSLKGRVYQSSHLRMMFINNLSMSGMDTRVMRTMTDPIPMVAYLAEVSLRPVVMNRLVE